MPTILEFTRETQRAVELLEGSACAVQGLVVLYSAIDTLAWADASSRDSTRQDFYAWVRQYMRPSENLGCTPEDLYAARCALLHAGSAESKMSREGKATPIWYVTEMCTLPKVQKIAQATRAPAKIVCTKELLRLFLQAVQTFSDAVARDPEREKRVSERIGYWFGRVPAAPTLEAWRSEL